MTTFMTRARVIQLWFSMLALLSGAWLTLESGITGGTAALLLALSMVPVAILLMLWPGAEPLTVREVLREQ
jgi:hypothetical protein